MAEIEKDESQGDFDWTAWDRQIEQDAREGKLDALVEQALRDHAAGKTTRL